jgi:outer membrane murein-binding lipoprotein Lpp
MPNVEGALMNANEWITLIAVVISATVVIGPGIVAVHAKLAVVATQVAELCDKVEKLTSSHEERLRMCIDHQSRLDLQEVQIADSIERLREMEC